MPRNTLLKRLLSAVPSGALGSSLAPAVARWWLGIPLLPTPDPCPVCGVLRDIFGDHAMACSSSGSTRRHNLVRNELATACGFAVQLEAATPDRFRPAEILVFCAGRGGRPLAIDVTVA